MRHPLQAETASEIDMVIGGASASTAKRAKLADAERDAGKARIAILQARFLQPAIADIEINNMPSQ